MSFAPFNEYEKRFLLTEIIKVSKVPIDTFLGIIREEQIEPNWTEIFLPPARTVNACRVAFQDLLSGSTAPPHPTGSFDPTAKPSLKRRFSDTEPSTGISRSIQPSLQPRPSPNGAGFAPARLIAETASKKRGRPTKEVLDARRAEAAARGTLYPPLKAAGRKSLGETPATQIGFGPEGPASEPGPKTGSSSDSPTVKKRRGRPTKEAVEAKKVALMTPQTLEAPSIPTEGRDLSHQAPDVLEVVERVQEPPPPTVPSAMAAQDSSKTVPHQPPQHPPSGQL